MCGWCREEKNAIRESTISSIKRCIQLCAIQIQSHQAIEKLRQMRELWCVLEINIHSKKKKNKKSKNEDTHTRIHNDFTYCSIASKHLLSIFLVFLLTIMTIG